MTTTFPGAVDALPRPSASSPMNVAPYRGSVVIDNISDAIEAVEAKLGIGASVAAANQVLRGTGAGATAFGQIATADLAANAITQVAIATPTTSSPTTTSTTAVDLPEMTVTYTVTAGSVVLVLFNAAIYHNTAGASITFALNHAGASIAAAARLINMPVANYNMVVSQIHAFVAGSSGSVTTKIQWFTSSGTLTAYALQRSLAVVELKR